MSSQYDPLNPATYGNAIIGGSGGTYSVFGTNADYTWTGPSLTQKAAKIHVQGDAVFEGNITWQDRDMREWFESIEARLSILKPNPDLEKEWLELAELRQRYVELERQLLEKQKVFNILKKS
jgi:hypothetical protein